MKRLLLLSVLQALPLMLFAGTLFETEKVVTDPFIGERGGFQSLFINPAGVAGESAFEISSRGGLRAKPDDVRLIATMTTLSQELQLDADTDFSLNSVERIGKDLSKLYDAGVINDALIDSLFNGTSLDPSSVNWKDRDAVEKAAQKLADNSSEQTILRNKVEKIFNEPESDEAKAFYNALPQNISMSTLVSGNMGFLIDGFGAGIYVQGAGDFNIDPSNRSFSLDSVHSELGVIAGGGFELFEGKLALGITGNYGVLARNSAPIPATDFESLINGPNSLLYGYSWGVDVGALWRPTPELGVGVVFNDVVGSTEVDYSRMANGYAGLFSSGAFFASKLDYKVTLDMDAGITWQPDWKVFVPRFSFDLYNVIGYAQDVIKYEDNFGEALNRSLGHMRFGANFTLFGILEAGAQYYNHYLSLGLGADLFILEVFGEVKVHDEVFKTRRFGQMPIGADVLVRLHF